MNQYKTSVKIIIIIKMNSVDSKKTALAKIDKNILNRYSLVNALINYPSVYVEMQSFFQTSFIYVAKHFNAYFEIDRNIASPRLGKFLLSKDFRAFLRTYLGFYRIEQVEDINSLANRHKHDEIIRFDINEVKKHYFVMDDFIRLLVKKVSNITLTPVSDKDFSELSSESNLSLIKDQMSDLNIRINELEQEINDKNTNYEDINKEIKSLKQALTKKEEIINKNKKQIKELSDKLTYDNGTLFGFKISSDFYVDDLVDLKRKGRFKEALQGYAALIEKKGFVYDFNDFKGMFKVAYLYNKFDLAFALEMSMLHYEINYFIKTLEDPDSINARMLMTQIHTYVQNNREFRLKMEEGLREKTLPPQCMIGAYSTNLVKYHIMTRMAMQSYDQEHDVFMENQIDIKAFKEEIQGIGNNSYETKNATNQLYVAVTNSDTPIYAMLDVLMYIKKHGIDVMNLAVFDQYHVKEEIIKALK